MCMYLTSLSNLLKSFTLYIYFINITSTLNSHSGKHDQLNKIKAPHAVEPVLQHFHAGNLPNDIYGNMNDSIHSTVSSRNMIP